LLKIRRSKNMSKLLIVPITCKAIIENIIKSDKNLTEKQAYLLTDIYSRTVNRMATTLARRSFYDLNDFTFINIDDELRGYSLEIERCKSETRFELIDRYIGIFTDSESKEILRIIAIVEKDKPKNRW